MASSTSNEQLKNEKKMKKKHLTLEDREQPKLMIPNDG